LRLRDLLDRLAGWPLSSGYALHVFGAAARSPLKQSSSGSCANSCRISSAPPRIVIPSESHESPEPFSGNGIRNRT
jgi:hypothetical protein